MVTKKPFTLPKTVLCCRLASASGGGSAVVTSGAWPVARDIGTPSVLRFGGADVESAARKTNGASTSTWALPRSGAGKLDAPGRGKGGRGGGASGEPILRGWCPAGGRPGSGFRKRHRLSLVSSLRQMQH